MYRTLSLVLDRECKVSLTLIGGTHFEIDDFTFKFENSDEIRDYFNREINEYLLKNSVLIDNVEKNTGRKYQGSIVILECIENNNELSFERSSVLYKKAKYVAKEAIKNQYVMRRLYSLDKIRASKYGNNGYISSYLSRIIFGENKYFNEHSKELNEWLKANPGKLNYFEKIRLLYDSYVKCREARPTLKTVDAIYKEQKLKVEAEVAKRKKTLENEKTFTLYENDYDQIVNVKFHGIESDDLFLSSLTDPDEIARYYDLDQLRTIDGTSDLFDGLHQEKVDQSNYEEKSIEKVQDKKNEKENINDSQLTISDLLEKPKILSIGSLIK